MTSDHYTARLYLVTRLYEDSLHVVFREVDLPLEFIPAPGAWLIHPELDARYNIANVGYDGLADCVSMLLHPATHDPTMTLEEWLERHDGWTEDPHNLFNGLLQTVSNAGGGTIPEKPDDDPFSFD